MLAIDWNQITGGSILVAALTLGSLIGGGAYAIRAIKQDNAETARQAIESWQATAEGRKEELDEARRTLADQAQMIGELQMSVHALELKLQEKETMIARLEERPNTEAILRLIEERAETNRVAIGQTSATQTEILHVLERNQETLERLVSHIDTIAAAMKGQGP